MGVKSCLKNIALTSFSIIDIITLAIRCTNNRYLEEDEVVALVQIVANLSSPGRWDNKLCLSGKILCFIVLVASRTFHPSATCLKRCNQFVSWWTSRVPNILHELSVSAQLVYIPQVPFVPTSSPRSGFKCQRLSTTTPSARGNGAVMIYRDFSRVRQRRLQVLIGFLKVEYDTVHGRARRLSQILICSIKFLL